MASNEDGKNNLMRAFLNLYILEKWGLLVEIETTA